MMRVTVWGDAARDRASVWMRARVTAGMTNIISSLLIGAAIFSATGCIPEHDYQGSYDMTYDVLLRAAPSGKASARAGTATVIVHQGLADEYLIDLGPSFCRLSGSYVKARVYNEWPYLDIRPQDCWLTGGGDGSVPLSVAGSATFDHGEERFSIVLTGNIVDVDRKATATLEFTESW